MDQKTKRIIAAGATLGASVLVAAAYLFLQDLTKTARDAPASESAEYTSIEIGDADVIQDVDVDIVIQQTADPDDVVPLPLAADPAKGEQSSGEWKIRPMSRCEGE